jgi:hypothetical protein
MVTSAHNVEVEVGATADMACERTPLGAATAAPPAGATAGVRFLGVHGIQLVAKRTGPRLIFTAWDITRHKFPEAV